MDRDGKIVHEVPLTVEHPNPHRDTRMARKLATGNYLVCHEARRQGPRVRPDGQGGLDLHARPRRPAALARPRAGGARHGSVRRRPLAAREHADRRRERQPGDRGDPRGQDRSGARSQDELPGIKLAWVTTLQVLENGNVIVGNCHAGPDNPQLFEVTRDKKVVWTFKDFKNFGNSLAVARVIGIEGKVIR